MAHKIDVWEKCYPSQWKGLIVPEAMSHPAKFSSKLIRRIYDHMLEEGWVRIGDRVVDPFGGVALGALEAMRHGLEWTGIELEAKFVELGSANIALWHKKFSRMPHWGTARLLQGDSRKLLEVIGRVDGAVSSPPYADSVNSGKGKIDWEKAGRPDRLTTKAVGIQGANGREEKCGVSDGQLGAMKADGFDAALSSPPFGSMVLHDGGPAFQQGGELHSDYGSSDGQLSAMPPGDFNASITSPPFRQAEGGTPEPKPGGVIDHALYARHAAGNSAAEGYGKTDGNLGNMDEPNGDFSAAISSPPFADSQQVDNRKNPSTAMSNFWHNRMGDTTDGVTEGQLSNLPAGDFDSSVSSPPFEDSRSRDFIDAQTRRDVARANGISNAEFVSPIDADRLKAPDDVYGDTEGQIGNDSGETFWTAARTIVEQVYAALAPGGHAVWVVKQYVKNKAIVPFDDQWRQLCEAVGFVTLHEHRASLVHHKGTSHTLEGGTVEHKTQSKSFFRRLAESKGSPEINYETIYCMVKE